VAPVKSLGCAEVSILLSKTLCGDTGRTLVMGWGYGFDMSSWLTVDNSENITLMNLRPVTAYVVKVQLSRPGDGGEGSKGPEAVMVTECLGGSPSPYSPCIARGLPRPMADMQ